MIVNYENIEVKEGKNYYDGLYLKGICKYQNRIYKYKVVELFSWDKEDEYEETIEEYTDAKVKLSNIKFKEFLDIEYKGDLVYYEGSLFSHFQCNYNKDYHYFTKLYNRTKNTNIWLVFSDSEYCFLEFFNKEITQLEWINKCNGEYYLVHLDADLNVVDYEETDPDNVPSDYLPSETAMFDETHFEPYCIELFNKYK